MKTIVNYKNFTKEELTQIIEDANHELQTREKNILKRQELWPKVVIAIKNYLQYGDIQMVVAFDSIVLHDCDKTDMSKPGTIEIF